MANFMDYMTEAHQLLDTARIPNPHSASVDDNNESRRRVRSRGTRDARANIFELPARSDPSYLESFDLLD